MDAVRWDTATAERPPATTMPRARVSAIELEMARTRVGAYSADLFAHLEKETVDLSTRLIVASATQTNFAAAVRAQLPYGQAMFVLDVRQPELPWRFEFLITADEYDAKGKKLHGKAAGK